VPGIRSGNHGDPHGPTLPQPLRYGDERLREEQTITTPVPLRPLSMPCRTRTSTPPIPCWADNVVWQNVGVLALHRR
jgi:hypothetical protein